MKNIFFSTDSKKIKQVYGDVNKERLAEIGLSANHIFTKNDLINHKNDLKDVTCIFSTWYMPVLTKEEIIEYFPSLKAVFYAAGTVKYFAKPYLENNIRVFGAGAANAIPVAEFAYAQILLANKGYYQAQALYKKRFYKKAKKTAEKHHGNYCATVGIVGAGGIGSRVMDYLKQHDLRILVFDKFLNEEQIKIRGGQKVSLETLFQESDVISNHLADVPETEGIFNYKLFMSMKENATLINTGRGRQVVEKDLARALKKRKDLCAVLDVCRHEPPWPHSPLYLRKNLFLTPHIAGSLNDEQLRMGEYMINEYTNFMAGKHCNCEITKSMIETMAI